MWRNIPRHSQRLPPYMGPESNNNFGRSYDEYGHQAAPKPITEHPIPLVLEFNPIERRPWRPWTGDTDSEEGTSDESDVDYESGFAGAAAPADNSDKANSAVPTDDGSEDSDAQEDSDASEGYDAPEGPDADEALSKDPDNCDSSSQSSNDSLDEYGDYKYYDFNTESVDKPKNDEESEEEEEVEEVQACTVWENKDWFENVEDSQGSEEDYDADNDESTLRHAVRIYQDIGRQLLYWLPLGFSMLMRLILWSLSCLTSDVIPFVYHLTKRIWLEAQSQLTFWIPLILYWIKEFLDWSKIQFLDFIPYGLYWIGFTIQCVKLQINKLISATKAIMN